MLGLAFLSFIFAVATGLQRGINGRVFGGEFVRFFRHNDPSFSINKIGRKRFSVWDFYRRQAFAKISEKFLLLLIVCRILGKDIHAGGFFRMEKGGIWQK